MIKMKEIQKRVYTTPEIQKVNLDNEISLQLASQVEPTPDPGEANNMSAPEYFSNDPYKMA